jgi:hypothetical protein
MLLRRVDDALLSAIPVLFPARSKSEKRVAEPSFGISTSL